MTRIPHTPSAASPGARTAAPVSVSPLAPDGDCGSRGGDLIARPAEPTWQRSCDHLLYGPAAEFMAQGRDWATTEAIRRKLVAYDDMLALLQELIDIEGPQPGTSSWAEKVRAAIARAKGAA